MIYVIGIILSFIHISLGAVFTVWGGSAYYFVAVLLIMAAEGVWYSWVVVLAFLLVTTLYNPVSFVLLLLIFIASVCSYTVFVRFVDRDNRWLRITVITFMVGLVIAFDELLHLRQITMRSLGSLVITLPLVAMWGIRIKQSRRLYER
jgi:hypothetical protein